MGSHTKDVMRAYGFRDLLEVTTAGGIRDWITVVADQIYSQNNP